MARDHVKGNQGATGADEVLVVGVEDAEVVLFTIVGSRGDLVKAERLEPCVNL